MKRLLLLLCLLLGLPTVVFAVCGTAPTVSFDKAGKYSASGESVDYIVSITNNDAGSCDLDLSIVSVDAAGFTSSLPNGTPLTVAGGATDTSTVLRVDVTGGTADWLTNPTTLRVEAVDTVATTTVFDNDPLLHNNINMGSTKHSSNWGTTKASSKYGSITCQTCHVQGTNNIKRVRTSITTPDNSNGAFPGDGMPIDFQSVTDGSSDLGDDGRADQTQSSAICETCHTYDAAGTNGVKYHGYDMSVPGDVGHYNQADCLKCHPHSAGFKASCASCHGGGTQGSVESNYWPDASSAAAENDQVGRHLEHMEALAQLVYGISASALLDDAGSDTKQKALCAYCHDTPGADGDHTVAGPAEVAMHPAWNVGAAASGSYTTGDGNCTNICHNNKATGVGTYGWHDAGTSTCLMCHNDMTNTGNTTGETHANHTNASTNFGRTIVCADCHHADTDWAGNTPPGANHIDGDFDLGGVVSLTYAGANTPPGTDFGGCGTNACHNDGKGGVPQNSGYQWDDNNLGDCTICHPALPTSDSHPAHVNTAETKYAGAPNADWATNNSTQTDYDFGCGNCHGSTLSAHLNGTATVTGVGFGAPSANQCSSNSCHQDGQGGAPNTAPTWGTPFTAGACNDCHGNHPPTGAHNQHAVEVGFHYDAIYSGLVDFMPVTDADAPSIDQNLDDGDGNPGSIQTGPVAAGYDQLRGHGGNLLADGTSTSTVVSCNVCHYEVVQVNSNDKGTACSACHDGAVAPLQGNAAIYDKSKHVNGAINVRFFEERIRSKAQVRDEKPYTYTFNSGVGETVWTKTTELTNNWHRFNGYKRPDGASYDEQPDTLHNMATAYNGGDPNYYSTATKTCMSSCHLWEAGRVDKSPVHWVDNATGGSAPLMCIDCHTRLPK